MSVDAQQSPEVSRLVVNILVDQLRTDYLESFAPLYGEGGLRRLMSQARYYTDSQYPFAQPDRASATASNSTGTVPYVHGIPAASWLSRETLQPVFCVDDARYRGLQTDERTSASYLLTTTLADELKLATGRKSLVYSIAPERDMAVLLAGHAADGAYWLNDNTGLWCGTEYYGALPTWLTAKDRQSPLATRLKDMTWEPVYDGAYSSFHYFQSNTEAKKTKGVFSHKFKGDRRIRQFKSSALAAEEVAELVERTIDATPLGRDAVPDMLCIGLYAGGFDGNTVVTAPSELQDTYVRLDSALARIINKVESIVGAGRTIFVVSSTGYSDTDASTYNMGELNLTSGTFSMERASLLLNMYLSALYGQRQYVTATRDSHIYLDARIIEQAQLRMADVLARSEEFLVQMAGVRDVYTATELAAAPGDITSMLSPTNLSAQRNAWSPRRSGDIIVRPMPGWRVECQNGRSYIEPGQPYTAYPIFILGPDVEAQRITAPVSATAIAPTIAASLRIRAPNGSTEAPLKLK